MTDNLALRISKKIVSGPFDHPPLINFRSNALMAIAQDYKVRPILNLSPPKDFSLNDAIDETKIPKIFMSTQKTSVSNY